MLPLRPYSRDDLRAVLDLNRLEEHATSPLDEAKLAAMIEMAFAAILLPEAAGFLIAFDQSASYDSVNFQWFGMKLARFVYVDRVVVAAHARGKGAARCLYDNLYDLARRQAHDRIVCEVNYDPPNPASEEFHQRQGFQEIGRAYLGGSGKGVRYLEKKL